MGGGVSSDPGATLRELLIYYTGSHLKPPESIHADREYHNRMCLPRAFSESEESMFMFGLCCMYKHINEHNFINFVRNFIHVVGGDSSKG